MSFRKPTRNYRKSKPINEKEQPTLEPSTTRHPAKKSHSKKAMDENRMESYRGVKSEHTTQQDKETLYEQLFFGYRNVTEAMKNLELNQSRRTLNLPISTRSCEFIIQNLVNRFVRLEVLTISEERVLAITNSGSFVVNCGNFFGLPNLNFLTSNFTSSVTFV